MEFVHKGRVPSAKFFYYRMVTNQYTGETHEDFGFKDDCVVMTQDEYEALKNKSEADNGK